MYDSAFDYRGLERMLKRADFRHHANLLDPEYRKPIIDAAVRQAGGGFDNFYLDYSEVKGRFLYQPRTIPVDIILRKLSQNIKILTGVRQSDRETVIKSLIALFAEGHAFRVYKFDLKNFYESVDLTKVEQLLSADRGFPPSSLRVFRSFKAQLERLGIPGLPQGMAISATLSEYLMRAFDGAVRKMPEVYFYARYVDDMIIVTTGYENLKQFKRQVRACLPMGLTLNHHKSRYFEFQMPTVNSNAIVENCVDFLGYSFSIYQPTKQNRSIYRKVVPDISPNKVSRIKTRIARSALQYLEDNRYNDLFDRLRMLSGNYNMYDRRKDMRRNVGIYFNYRHVKVAESSALHELDSYLQRFILAKQGRICGRLQHALNKQQKSNILSLSFAKSAGEKTFYHFNSTRLAELVRCWAHV